MHLIITTATTLLVRNPATRISMTAQLRRAGVSIWTLENHDDCVLGHILSSPLVAVTTADTTAVLGHVMTAFVEVQIV